VSVARFIADQRTMHRVPHAVSCGILGVSLSWFYKWINRRPTPRQARRADLDIAVKDAFDASQATYGSPRIHADLVEAGWTVSVNTVADSMRRQGLQGRKPKRRRGLTRQDRSAPKFPDLLAPRLHRRGTEREMVRRYHRDPHRLDSWGRRNALMEKRSWRCLIDWWVGWACGGIRLASGNCSFGCWIVGARFGRRRWGRGSRRILGTAGGVRLGWPPDARGPGPTRPRRRPSSSGCFTFGATSLRWLENSAMCG